ncbi:MAG: amidohydrolase family protein [Solimonas sp.]
MNDIGLWPRFQLPPRSCDAHCHVFGPADRFAYAAQRRYTPEDAPKEALAALHARLGIDRCVIVQGACYGTDHAALLDAVAAAPSRRRGVALINDSVDDVELQRLHDGGVRAARFNFVRRFGELPDADLLARTTARIAGFGWHLVLHFDPGELLAQADWLRSLETTFVIDHFGRVAPEHDGEDARLLLELARRRHCWIKISGVDRVCPPPFRSAVPLARALLDAAPDRVLWGSDFPHPNARHPANDDELVELIPEFAPAAELRQRVLVDNPARLYGFTN